MTNEISSCALVRHRICMGRSICKRHLVRCPDKDRRQQRLLRPLPLSRPVSSSPWLCVFGGKIQNSYVQVNLGLWTLMKRGRLYADTVYDGVCLLYLIIKTCIVYNI